MTQIINVLVTILFAHIISRFKFNHSNYEIQLIFFQSYVKIMFLKTLYHFLNYSFLKILIHRS